MDNLNEFVKYHKKAKFAQNPKKYFENNNLNEYLFLIKDNITDTKKSIFKYLYGSKKCEYCKNKVNRILPGWNGFMKTCSNECKNKLLSINRIGEKNPCHKMTNETKNNMKIKLSEIMKNKILNGTFTPKTENYKCYGMIDFYLNNEIRKVRSLWEVFFWLENPNLEYEKIRIEYFNLDKNKNSIYIADFYDQKTNTIYEVKPKKYQYTLKEKQKKVDNLNYNYIIIDENYFKKYETDYIKTKIKNSLVTPEKYSRRLKWIKSWKKD